MREKENLEELNRKQTDAAEGDLETVEESLRSHEQRDKEDAKKGGSRTETHKGAA